MNSSESSHPTFPASRMEETAALVRGVLQGEFRSIARAITMVENGSPRATALLRSLFPHTGRCLTVGVTGAPGSGKSTLVDALAGRYRGQGKSVGIIAVDPSSPFSGGAILGDRIRMQSRSLDSGTFIRSMATRGNLGGLSRATADASLVLDAAGFDLVVIETVGVGQDEVEIAGTALVTLVLLVPGMGDDIQAMKAGIMEIGDIFVINKADHAGVERVESELKSLLSLGGRDDGWNPPVLRTVASEDRGIEACIEAIAEYSGFLQTRRPDRLLRLQRERLMELVRSQLLQRLSKDQAASELFEALAGKVASREMDPYSAAESIIELLVRRAAKET